MNLVEVVPPTASGPPIVAFAPSLLSLPPNIAEAVPLAVLNMPPPIKEYEVAVILSPYGI
jgi:hypothetical protein